MSDAAEDLTPPGVINIKDLVREPTSSAGENDNRARDSDSGPKIETRELEGISEDALKAARQLKNADFLIVELGDFDTVQELLLLRSVPRKHR